MEPHFVFNALNTIASFIRTDPDRARGLVLAFADYLRSRSSRGPASSITLDEELRHVQSYLDLEQARFGSQLQVTIDARAGRAATCACRRSSSSRSSRTRSSTARPTGRCTCSCARACGAGRLRVTVRDDGRGIAREAIERVLEPGVGGGTPGLGLANVNRLG